MLVELNRLKKHLNLDSSFNEDDDYIEFLENVAEDLVQIHIDKKLDEIIAEKGELPAPLLHAILLFVGNMYENRESIAYTPAFDVPKSLSYILNMYRDYENANI
jgi:uncharacterized phage protein (predicted DNA packaging)